MASSGTAQATSSGGPPLNTASKTQEMTGTGIY